MATAKKRIYGEGTVILRDDGRYQISVPGPDGKRRYGYAKDEKEAQQKRRKMLHDVEQGRMIASKQPFKVHAEEWLEMKRRGGYAPSTYSSAILLFEKHVLPALGHLPLNKITPAHIQRLYTKMLDQGLVSNTVRTYHHTLKPCFNMAVKQGKLDLNPCDRVALPRKSKSKNTHLTKEDTLKLITFCKGHATLETLIPLALGSGARESELLALTWDDVDMKQGTIKITKTISRKREEKGRYSLLSKPPKSEDGVRTLSLPAFAIEALRENRVKQLKQQPATGVQNPKNLLFPNRVGGYKTSTTIFNQFKHLVSKLGWDMTFHDLRHTNATLLLEEGVPPHVVQERLGHSDVAITLSLYGHVTKKMQDNAVQSLNSLFTGEKNANSGVI